MTTRSDTEVYRRSGQMLTYVAGMLVEASMMAMKKQGAEVSMPTAQISGSALGTRSRSRRDIQVPKDTPTIPVTTVIAPNM